MATKRYKSGAGVYEEHVYPWKFRAVLTEVKEYSITKRVSLTGIRDKRIKKASIDTSRFNKAAPAFLANIYDYVGKEIMVTHDDKIICPIPEE